MTYKEISEQIKYIENDKESLETLMKGTVTEIVCQEVMPDYQTNNIEYYI